MSRDLHQYRFWQINIRLCTPALLVNKLRPPRFPGDTRASLLVRPRPIAFRVIPGHRGWFVSFPPVSGGIARHRFGVDPFLPVSRGYQGIVFGPPHSPGVRGYTRASAWVRPPSPCPRGIPGNRLWFALFPPGFRGIRASCLARLTPFPSLPHVRCRETGGTPEVSGNKIASATVGAASDRHRAATAR
jgi:hypothetical protein